MTTTTTATNIKGLPEGATYWTEYGYTQTYPYVEVKRTAHTVTLRRVETTGDPEWKEKAIWFTGGFAGHCANQHAQTWLYAGLGEGTITIYRTKRGWGRKGAKFAEGVARYFYDYNF